MTTLRDLLNDFAHDVIRIYKETEYGKDAPAVEELIDEYIEIIVKRIIGE